MDDKDNLGPVLTQEGQCDVIISDRRSRITTGIKTINGKDKLVELRGGLGFPT